MRMRMRRKKHRTPMMDRRRMWRAEGIVGFLGTSYVDGYEGKDGDDVYADEEAEASLADVGSMQIVED